MRDGQGGRTGSQQRGSDLVGVLQGRAVTLFLQRGYPNSNTVILPGRRPVLVDPGFGSGAPALEVLLRQHDLSSAALTLIVNTHFHTDHAGGNHAIQSVHGTIVAAHHIEAQLVNARNPDACRAQFLSQPIEAYTVGRALRDGDLVGTGDTAWEVIETPGHTRGHIALWSEQHRTLVSGDALHANDVGWINPFSEGPDSLAQSMDSVERLAGLQPALILPGHGPEITDTPAAFENARRRLLSWKEQPERMAWHACKRIFAYALMLTDGMTDEAADDYLRTAPWVGTYATEAFALSVDTFMPLLFTEMRRAGAAAHQDGHWTALTPHDGPRAGWPQFPATPADWPPPRPVLQA